ncbi:hypothetical protein [Treponema phagedenis]|uniref:hypothetical protein n=1 Tax=Treponema phagedenis TaxID=162 RepID=UPI0011EDF161|nr:hypothetical protein [Treponema phagedenis]TYT76373.1 hypothetical protein FS559_15265 [Treponema phagedenis]
MNSATANRHNRELQYHRGFLIPLFLIALTRPIAVVFPARQKTASGRSDKREKIFKRLISA